MQKFVGFSSDQITKYEYTLDNYDLMKKAKDKTKDLPFFQIGYSKISQSYFLKHLLTLQALYVNIIFEDGVIAEYAHIQDVTPTGPQAWCGASSLTVKYHNDKPSPYPGETKEILAKSIRAIYVL